MFLVDTNAVYRIVCYNTSCLVTLFNPKITPDGYQNMLHGLLPDIILLFSLALVTVVIFQRLKFPSIIGFLFTGIMAGPHMLGLIRETHQVEQLSELGVVLLLFSIGIELSMAELMRIRKLVMIGGGLQVGITTLLVAALTVILGYSINQGLFFGFIVALSSTAILMKLLMDAGQLDAPHGKTAFGVLIFQDLCIVPMMLMTPLLAGQAQGITDILLICAKAAAVILGAYYGTRLLIPWIFHHVVGTRSRELFILTIILVGFGTAWLTAMAGLSLALGAFIAGLAISESDYSHQAINDLIPFREAFMSLFFISVGMLLNPAVILQSPLTVLLVIVAIIIIKTAVSCGAAMFLGIPYRISLLSALLLTQIGEFSFVLAHSGLEYGLINRENYQIFLAASIATMGLTPFMLKIAPWIAERTSSWMSERMLRGFGKLSQTAKKMKLEDHVIIVGYGLNGRNLAKVLKHLNIKYVAIETNPFTVSSEKKRGNKLIFGDATNQEILSHACIETARIMVVAISDATASRRIAAQARSMSSTIRILVRTRYVLEMEPLFKLGVNEVIPEEFETSVEILSRVLKTFLVSQDDIEQCVNEIRRDGYEMFRSMSRRHSHAIGIGSYLSGAEIATLEVRKGARLEGESLREGTLRNYSGSSIIAIKRGKDITPNPDPVWQLAAGDVVLILGTPDQIRVAAPLFESPQ